MSVSFGEAFSRFLLPLLTAYAPLGMTAVLVCKLPKVILSLLDFPETTIVKFWACRTRWVIGQIEFLNAKLELQRVRALTQLGPRLTQSPDLSPKELPERKDFSDID